MSKRNPIPQLSILEPANLRDIWKDEAGDFTPWLAEEENLSLLGEALGIDLEVDETESGVGSFNVDILAHEAGSNRVVIIENQLEDSDHDHLGKTITYASGKNASIVVWIVRHARDEHTKAVEWLNNHTDDDVVFFLVEIQAWRIGDSDPAPKFNVVERPNEWAKAIKASDDLTPAKKAQLEYWTEYREYGLSNEEFAREFKPQKPHPQHWSDLHLGYRDIVLSLTVNTQQKTVRCDYYIRDNFELMDELWSHADELEELTGAKPSCSRGSKDGRISFERRNSDIMRHRDQWHSFMDWQFDIALKLKSFIYSIRA